MGLDKAAPLKMVVKEFPTPDLKDVVIMEEVDQTKFDANPTLYALEAPHPDSKRYPNHFVAAVSPRGYGAEAGVKVYYLKSRLAQENYNFKQVSKSSSEWPKLVQWWVIQRKNYNSAVASWTAPPAGINGTWTYMDHDMRPLGDEVFDTLFVLVLAEWWDISTKLKGAAVRDDTGEVFPTLRSVVLASDAKANGSAVSSTGAASRVTPITAKWVQVEEFVEPTLATGQTFTDYEFDPQSGLTLPSTRRIVAASATVQDEVNSDGQYQESTQLTLAKRLRVTKYVGMANREYEWSEVRAFAWPPVLVDGNWQVYPRGGEGFEYDWKDYQGLTHVELRRYWSKTAPTVSELQMVPTGIRWSGVGAFSLPPCLHDSVTITESMTVGLVTNTYSRTYPATNVVDWPESVTRLDQVTPYMGGYLVTEATYYSPDV